MIFFVNSTEIKYQFWLSVPRSPRRLVFWFHGSTGEPTEQLATRRPIEFELALSVVPEDCIVVTPLIPKIGEGVGDRIIDPQCLSRNVLFDDLIDPGLHLYNRPDKEVLKMFDYLRKFIFPVLGITMDRFMVGGFSAGGNFAPLFAVLHPQWVTHVMSLISCSYCLPAETVEGVPFHYPFGLGGLGRVSDITPDPGVQRQIKYFIYHGELDENDPVEHLANNDSEEAKAIKSVMGQTTGERFRHALQFLAREGFAVEGKLIAGIGHEIHDRAELKGMLTAFLAG